MHEIGVVLNIVKSVDSYVQRNGLSEVSYVNVDIGELSGVVPGCIHEYFGVAAKGTIAEGAKIIIETAPIRIRCRDCGFEGEISKGTYACPRCGSPGFRIISGREYFVESVEAE